MNINEQNRWAVYPIEKIEAAMKNLSDAVAEARRLQAETRAQQTVPSDSLSKLLCPGCRDKLYKDGPTTHIWIDGTRFETCLATPERLEAIRQWAASIITALPVEVDGPTMLTRVTAAFKEAK